MLLKMSYLKIWSHKKMYNWPPLWAAVVLMSADDWCAWHVSKCLVFRLPGKRDGDLCRNSKTTVAPRSFTLSTKSFSDSEYIFELQDSTKIQASQRCLSISSISVFIPTLLQTRNSRPNLLLSEGIHALWRWQKWKSRHLTSPRCFSLQPSRNWPFELPKLGLMMIDGDSSWWFSPTHLKNMLVTTPLWAPNLQKKPPPTF